MLTLNNRILKRSIAMLLTLALILSGLFYSLLPSYGLTKEVAIHHIRLDTAVVFVWSDGKSGWQKGIAPNQNFQKEFLIDIGKNMKNIKVDNYDGSNFPFDWSKDTDIYKQHWNPTNACKNASDYKQNYMPYSAIVNSVGDSTSYSPTTGKMYLKYNVVLAAKGGNPYNVKDTLNTGGQQKILDLLGNNPPADLTEAMNLFSQESAKIDPKVQGYLYFVPVITEYDEVTLTEVPDPKPEEIDAEVDTPSTVKTGQTFSVSDATLVGKETILSKSVLYRIVDSGAKEKTAEWQGTGRKGENTGGKIEQSFSETGSVVYEIVATTVTGQQDIDRKKTIILDSREMEGQAILSLPRFTYEGHKVPARDLSEFTVDGVGYSAKRMYAEGLARNNFNVVEDTPHQLSRVDDTHANIVFDKRGNYNVKLDIEIRASGKKLSDTKPIEVRKTPTIEDSLGGTQKQNRTQDVLARVATHPSYPITETWIEIEDLKTGEKIRHNYGNSEIDKLNDEHIKTRQMAIVQAESDEYFTKFDLAFLTKPLVRGADENREYKYTIFAKDAKGDTDQVTKNFTVKPDLAPEPVISIDNTFLREKGTNVAKIRTEDASVSKDGDDVERTWKYEQGMTLKPSKNMSTMDGFEKLSFGMDKIVGFNKTGVGKFTVGLELKDKWIEPTLPEYITEEDYLTGSAVTLSQVDNVAPVVSLKPIKTMEANILLLAGGAKEYDELVKNRTSYTQEFLRNGIDANITIQQIKDGTPSNVTGITSLATAYFPFGLEAYGSVNESTIAVADDTYIYYQLKTWNGKGQGDYPRVPFTVHSREPYSNTEKWVYTTMDSGEFSMGQDDSETYLYLIYSNKTVLLDKKTGTVSGVLPFALGSQNFLTDKFIYSLKGSDLFQVSVANGTIRKAQSDVDRPRRIGNNLQYIYKSKADAVSRVTLNLNSEKVTMRKLIGKENNPYYDGLFYQYVGMDGQGNALIYKSVGGMGDTRGGFFLYSPDNKVIKSIRFDSLRGDQDFKPIMTEDEKGECNYVAIQSYRKSGKSAYFTIEAWNLNTGGYDYLNGSLATKQDSVIPLERNGVAYLIYFGDYIYVPNSSGGWLSHDWNHYTYTFDGAHMSHSVSGPGNMDFAEENGFLSNRFLVSVTGDNSPDSPSLSLKIMGTPRSKNAEVTNTIIKYAKENTESQNEINTLILSDRTSSDVGDPTILAKAIDRIRKTGTEFIAAVGENTSNYATDIAASVQGLVVTGIKDLKDNIEGTVSEVISKNVILQKEGAKPVLQIAVNGGSSIGTITKDVKLLAGKQYFYEYDLKKVTEKEETAGIMPSEMKAQFHTVRNPEAAGSSERYYVAKVYEENFSEGKMDKFFQTKTQTWKNGLEINRNDIDYQGGWAGVASSSKYSLNTATISFTIPKGKKAIVMMDYSVSYWYKNPGGVYVNGSHITNEVVETKTTNQLSGSYTHPSVLHEGANEITMVAANGNSTSSKCYSLIDNLKIFIVQDTPIGSDAAGNKIEPLTNNWENVSGNFTTYNSATSFARSNATWAFVPEESFDGSTTLKIDFPSDEKDTKYLLQNLKLYYMLDGRRVYVEDKYITNTNQMADWNRTSNIDMSVVKDVMGKEEDQQRLVYKKGQLVTYNIFYSDYESDPSKKEYWRYIHEPFNDGAHPDAAVIVDENGKQIGGSGKVLNKAIDRFYLDGKYTVQHWQEDNTGDLEYDKKSNVEEITFYIEGTGEAPWVTYIKTIPSQVKEGQPYRLQIGVDDKDKDVLRLRTEVYKDKKLVYTHNATGLTADITGAYPPVITGFAPNAKVGVYEVVCTVRDWFGAGIGTYKFTVVSDGKITGYVNHTDQWDQNRKKYNLKQFHSECNVTIPFNDYLKLSVPRKRGVNVFWSGEKFMLQAAVAGNPNQVTSQIQAYPAYKTTMKSTGRKNAQNETIYVGELWDKSMINKWGRKAPQPLTFRFTAAYDGGTTKTHDVVVIVDSKQDYWQLHRLW